jgi:hypothetical protein
LGPCLPTGLCRQPQGGAPPPPRRARLTRCHRLRRRQRRHASVGGSLSAGTRAVPGVINKGSGARAAGPWHLKRVSPEPRVVPKARLCDCWRGRLGERRRGWHSRPGVPPAIRARRRRRREGGCGHRPPGGALGLSARPSTRPVDAGRIDRTSARWWRRRGSAPSLGCSSGGRSALRGQRQRWCRPGKRCGPWASTVSPRRSPSTRRRPTAHGASR